jgi:tRNA wybutosine-synthesizing protein 2
MAEKSCLPPSIGKGQGGRVRDFRKLIIDCMRVPKDKQECLPRGFQRVGHIVILNLRPEVSGLAKGIARVVLDNYPYVRTVCLGEGVSGELRKPSVKWLAGERDTETIHTENKCRFRLDVTNVMLSKGNLHERGRIPRLVKTGEVVVDMFAGIGYFSLPIAKLSRPERVYAIEKNPHAFRYLKENIRINRVQDVVTPIMGDCREARMGKVADRVIMGYLPGTERFLTSGFKVLTPEGGVMHYHDNYRERELWDKPLEVLEREAFRMGYALKKVTHKAVVKEYAPRVYHVVVDAVFLKG